MCKYLFALWNIYRLLFLNERRLLYVDDLAKSERNLNLTEAPFSTWAKMSKGGIVYIVRAFLFSSKWCSHEIVF